MNHKIIMETIQSYVKKGGPNDYEYNEFLKIIDEVQSQLQFFSDEQIKELYNSFADTITLDTLQGRAINKPFGYSGDFLMIDSLYTRKTSDNDKFKNWDNLVQNLEASKAVRNRKLYFLKLLIEKSLKFNNNFNVLNVASGPGRDLQEFFMVNPECKMNCDCIEQDLRAIDYAKCLLDNNADRVNFIPKNAIRFQTEKKYDLIWSGGLFDYFEDNVFVKLLKRYYSFLNESGELVIGNFAPNNPSKNYMELMNWILIYRSEEQLLNLANECGFNLDYVKIGKEPEGINLFLHILKH